MILMIADIQLRKRDLKGQPTQLHNTTFTKSKGKRVLKMFMSVYVQLMCRKQINRKGWLLHR